MTLAAFAAWIVNYQALAAAVLLVATVAGLLVRQPARRSALDWATLAGLLALAALSALPGWPRVALFERPSAELQLVQPPAPVAMHSETPSLSPREFAPRFEPRPPRAASQPNDTPLLTAAPPQVAPPSPEPEPWRWSDLAAPLASAYRTGMGLVVLWLLWGAVESWRLVRRAAPPADDLLATLAGLAEGTSPRLLVSGDVSAAAALGALRPTILVTPQLAAAPAEVVRAVLAHELAHLRHGDLWFLALGRAGLLLLYPQPLYWWLRRRAFDAREALADAAAAGAADRTQYAELLVAAARTLSGPPRRGPALAILERPSQLGRRIKLLLDPRGAIELHSSRRWRWLGAAAAAAVVLAASLVQVMPAAVGQAEEKAAVNKDQKSASTAEVKPADASQQDVAEAPYHAVEADEQGALTYSGVLVEHESGKPIAGGTVIVKRMAEKDEEYVLHVLETTEHISDQDGRFHFTIPREQAAMRLFLTVEAHHPSFAARGLPGYGLGVIRQIERLGRPPFFSRIEMLPGIEVAGIIEDPQGEVVADLEVKFLTVDPAESDPRSSVSRSEGSTRTDANGRFTFNALRRGESTFWVAPSSAVQKRDLATKTVYLGKRTGDIGRIRLQAGQRIAGRVFDAQGAALEGASVRAMAMEPLFLRSAAGSRDERRASSNQQGEFFLDPLPPGKYRVSATDKWGAPVGNPPITPLRAVFKPQILELEDKPGTTVEFKAVPHFTLEAQWVDSSGQPTSGHSVMVTGKWDGEHYATQGLCDDTGHVIAVIPRGMTEVRFKPTTSEQSTFRIRRGQDGALLEGSELDLGTPTEDVPDLFIVRYAAPIVVIRARDAAGRPIKDFRPRIDYRNAALRKEPRSQWVTGAEGDISLEQAPDGSWRSSQLRPDEEMSVRGAAPGFRAASRELKLPEGKTEEVEFVLEPLAPGEAEPEGARARPQRPATYYSPRVYRPVQPDAAGALTYRSLIVDRETGMPVEGAKVIVKRYDYGAGGTRTIAESAATTDDVGDFSFTLPAEQVSLPRMYLAFDVQHPGYVQQLFHAGELSAVRARERMGLAPEFQKLELAPGEPIFGQIVTPAGQPLPGLAVRYLTMSPAAHGSSEGTRTESQTTTDAEGRFRFNGVRGGLTRLWVEPADYAPRTLLLGKRSGDLGRIEVQAGQRLTGTLLDVDGRPVTDAWVRVGPKSYPFVQRTPGEQGQRTAQTNAHGRFTLAPLLPGEYQASVSGRDANNRESPEPESPLPAVFLTQLVTVGADEATNDVTLKAVPHVRVEVKCVDEAGQPADAERFVPFSGLEGKVGDVLVYNQARLEGADKLTLLAPRGLRDATLSLGLLADEHVYTHRGEEGAWAADRSLRLGTLDRDVDDVYVTSKKSPVVVVEVFNLQGEPIATARPRVDYPRGALGVPEPRRWPSGIDGQAMLGLQPDGRWRSEGLMPDQEFTLTMLAPGYRSLNKVFKLAAGETERVTFQLEPAPPGEPTIGLEPEPEGEPLIRLKFDLGPMEDESAERTPQTGDGAAATKEREADGFRLVWDEGPMEEDGVKRASEQAQGQNGPDAKSIEDSRESNSRGWTYWGGTIGAPLSGAPPAGSPPRSITRPEDLPKGFTAYRPGDTPPAPSPTTLFGVVTDDQGQPVPGVKVDAWHWFEGNETTTDSQGRFELRGFEPHEPLEIVFTKEGFSPWLRTGVKAGTMLEATLDDKTSVVGTIHDPAGQPVVGAVVRASHEAKLKDGVGVPLDFETKTDAEGRYRLLVARGNFDLWARKPGVGVAQRAFVLADPARPETVDLQLEPGVRFEARLRDALTGKPVAGVTFKTWRFPDVQATSEENGALTIESLPAARFDLHVEAPGYARWWSPQTAFPADRLNPDKANQWQRDFDDLRFDLTKSLKADVALEPQAILRGQVVDPEGAPVAGATVGPARTGSGNSISGDTRFNATTDEQGRFELHLPASGAVEYNLVAHDGDWRTSRAWANGYGEPLRTTPGQTLEGLELRMTKGANVRGRVVDVQGRPVAGKEVVAKANHPRANRYFQPRGTADAEGRFELRNVEGGSNYVMVEEYSVPEEGPPGSWRRIEVKPGEDQRDVRLISELPQPATGELFRIDPAYLPEVESEQQAREPAAEAFHVDATPADAVPR